MFLSRSLWGAVTLSVTSLLQPSFAELKVHDSSWSPDYVLYGTAKNVSIACESRYSVLLNGTSPGPPLYLEEGKTTWIRVYNQIPNSNLTVVSQEILESSKNQTDPK